MGTKYAGKGSIKPFRLVFISLILSIAISIPTYTVLDWFTYAKPLGDIDFNLIYTSVIGTLLVIIFILSGILIGKASREHSNARELKNFKNFTDALHQATSEIEVLEILFNFVRNIFPVTHVTLFYRNERVPDDNVWQRITNERLPVCNMSPKSCPMIQNGHTCLIQNISKEVPCSLQLPEHKNGSYISIPIADSEGIHAILQLYSKSKFFFDFITVSKIKSYIEVAKPIISSQRTLSALSKKASTDKLTKLYNRSFLDPYLDNQIEASSLSNQMLSIIIVDIDHFKRINDTYGHDAGDAVLVLFSQIILRCIRKTDLVARYGGEEFLVVLPSTNTETAITIAERIRETVASETMPYINGVTLPNISCSLGISTFPLLSSGKNDLVKTADIALYKAKQTGRNRTQVFERGMSA